jgi:hypothetical protein
MAGEVAGNQQQNGRWRIAVDGIEVSRSHLVWFWVYGYFPVQLDHKDRDCSNDRISNLREATQSQNLGNRSMLPQNTSGYRSVSYDRHKRRWRARIAAFGKRQSLGTYKTREEAAAVISARGKQLFGEFWYDGKS